MNGTFEVAWIPPGTTDDSYRITEQFAADKWPFALAWFCERIAVAEGCEVTLTYRENNRES